MDAIARIVVVHSEVSSSPSDGDLARLLRAEHEVRGSRECLELLRRERIACCVIPDADEDERGREIAAWLESEDLDTQLICLVSPGSLWGRDIIPTFRCTILERGCPPNLLRHFVESALERVNLRAQLRHFKEAARRLLPRITGMTPASVTWRDAVQAAASHSGPVLICGEPGSGKTHTAREIHRCSDRSETPLRAIDCSLHTAETLEAELHADGMLSGGRASVWPAGATRLSLDRPGTLVLENIECVPAGYQKHLLQLFEMQQTPFAVSEVGRPPVARLLATTQLPAVQVDLSPALVDLLSRTMIHVPPLRERRGDIAALADCFLRDIALRSGQVARSLSAESAALLANHVWQRNAAEFYGLLECVCQVTVDPVIAAPDVTPWLTEDVSGRGRLDQGLTLRQMERLLIEATFARCAGNRERTAHELGIGLRTLSGKLRAYGYPPRGGPGSNREHRQLRVA